MNGDQAWEQAPGRPYDPPAYPAGTVPDQGRVRRGVVPRGWATVTLVAVVAVIGAGAGVAGGVTAQTLRRSSSTAEVTGPTAPVREGTPLADLVASVAQSVISIEIIPAVSGTAVRAAVPATDRGSGVVVSRDGLILTNNHLLYPAASGGEINVLFSNGRSTPATIVATEPAADLALLRPSGLFEPPGAVLGDSDTLRVGDTVIAIGNALGLPGSVTRGVVSALHRTVTVDNLPGAGARPGGNCPAQIIYRDAIQTDAAINPGNSGGPLFNRLGQVIGIASVIGSIGTSDGSIGVGFAIPINDVKDFINRRSG